MKKVIVSYGLLFLTCSINIHGKNHDYLYNQPIFEDIVIGSSKFDDIKEIWNELGLPLQKENKKTFQKNFKDWFSNRENQQKFLEKLQNQFTEGNLISSPEVQEIFKSIESNFIEWLEICNNRDNALKNSWNFSISKKGSCCNKSIEKTEVNENNAVEYIQQLREESQTHKDDALDLALQSTLEALGAGITAVSGVEILALIEVTQASRHLVESCEEYNTGIRLEHEADLLEKQYVTHEDGSETKEWWEFWK